jgi:hypothetical protein
MIELKNRGVEDVLIAVVDGLKGFPDAITTRPVQCVACRGGLPHGSARILATVAAGSGFPPGLRVLSRNSPSIPCSAKRR